MSYSLAAATPATVLGLSSLGQVLTATRSSHAAEVKCLVCASSSFSSEDDHSDVSDDEDSTTTLPVETSRI